MSGSSRHTRNVIGASAVNRKGEKALWIIGEKLTERVGHARS